MINIVRNNMHFVLYRFYCKDQHSVNTSLEMSGKVHENLGNLMMTREWPVCGFCGVSCPGRTLSQASLTRVKHLLLPYDMFVIELHL